MPTTVYPVSEGKRFSADANLTSVVCATCHMTYAIPSSLYQSALKYRGDTPNGWKLCCPVGHTWWYVGETKEDRLEREVQEERRRRLAERELRVHTERRLTAQKGATTKAKKRHAAGLCPCCNRSFSQLRRHMEEKHPDYKPSSAP